MNLAALLKAKEEIGRPVRVGLIGTGKFSTMYLAQVRKVAGTHLVGVADLSKERALQAFKRANWPSELLTPTSLSEAAVSAKTCILQDSAKLISSEHIDIIIEATGNPEVGIKHAMQCFEHKKHIVMVNVEADVVAGPYLAQKAKEAGVIYSLAYGDQPAMICDMVDWARAAGFEVVAAGKGTKYLPMYHKSTPDTIWDYYGIDKDHAKKAGLNPKMFNSFLDGTKSSIEMAAVSNATGLLPDPEGLKFPPCGADDLPTVLRPQEDGGVLHHSGQVEVISSLERDGRPVYRDLRWGIYVVIKGDSEYMKECYEEYGMLTDESGTYTALYRPYHMIGLELGITIASIGARNEPTGSPIAFNADVVSTAKQDLAAGEVLDGEGGYFVYGKLMRASDSLRLGGVPLGLCNNVTLKRDVKEGQPVCWDDIDYDSSNYAIKIRKEMEAQFKQNE
jgi:predicted homoserine dehydrogenase-like protein